MSCRKPLRRAVERPGFICEAARAGARRKVTDEALGRLAVDQARGRTVLDIARAAGCRFRLVGSRLDVESLPDLPDRLRRKLALYVVINAKAIGELMERERMR